MADWYSDFLFHKYLPGLKYKTYQAILERNTKLYGNDIASGAMTAADVKHLSAQQSNAGFGHLNYADFARNPTIQHLAQLGLVAPDFLEARARFTGQAITGLLGGKAGREQIATLATLALGQAFVAYTAAKMTGGEYDPKHPFEFTRNGRKYTMRSVPEDLDALRTNWRQFANNRLSLLGKAAQEYSSGRDFRGHKTSNADITKDLAESTLPLTVQSALKLRNTNLSAWEQLLGSVGIKVSYHNPRMEAALKVNDAVEMLAPKLRKLPLSKRESAAIHELNDLPPADRAKAILKLRRQGVFTYQ
jgi:hypothetical protein